MKITKFVVALALGAALSSGAAMAQSEGKMGNAVELAMGGHKMMVHLVRNKTNGKKYVIMESSDFEAMMGGKIDDNQFVDWAFPPGNGY